MDLTPTEVDDLLAAWALGALDDDEAAAVEAALADDPDLRSRAAILAAALTELGEADAVPPPPDLRSDLLREAAASRPDPDAAGTDPLTLFRHRVEAVVAIAADLTPDHWSRPAPPYRWSAHGLLAHLLVIERYTARQLGLTGQDPLVEDIGHLDLGSDEIAAEVTRSPALTVAAWAERARATADALARGHGPGPGAVVPFHGWPFGVDALLTIRAFELWTHGEDLSRLAGLALEPPPAADLRALSSFSVGTLPLIVSLDTDEPPIGPARIVLTGDGGGIFDLGPAGSPGTVVVADVIDYCRLAGRRATVEDIAPTMEGDTELARRLLRAAQFLAV